MKWPLILLLLLVLAAWLWGDKAVRTVLDFKDRGLRLSRSTMDGNSVVQDPADLLAQASKTLGRDVDPDAYALARMIRSEASSGSVVEKTTVAFVAVKDRDRHGWSMLYTVAGPDYRFGRQIGWRYATSKDPYEIDLQVAEAVLAGRVADPAPGALKFVHVSAFGVQAGTSSYDELVTRWAAEGLEPRTVEGAGDDLRVFVRAV